MRLAVFTAIAMALLACAAQASEGDQPPPAPSPPPPKPSASTPEAKPTAQQPQSPPKAAPQQPPAQSSAPQPEEGEYVTVRVRRPPQPEYDTIRVRVAPLAPQPRRAEVVAAEPGPVQEAEPDVPVRRPRRVRYVEAEEPEVVETVRYVQVAAPQPVVAAAAPAASMAVSAQVVYPGLCRRTVAAFGARMAALGQPRVVMAMPAPPAMTVMMAPQPAVSAPVQLVAPELPALPTFTAPALRHHVWQKEPHVFPSVQAPSKQQ